jgi:hypothetical protein
MSGPKNKMAAFTIMWALVLAGCSDKKFEATQKSSQQDTNQLSQPQPQPQPQTRCGKQTSWEVASTNANDLLHRIDGNLTAAQCSALCESTSIAKVCEFWEWTDGTTSCNLYDANSSDALTPIASGSYSRSEVAFSCSSTSEVRSGAPQDFARALYLNLVGREPSSSELLSTNTDTSLTGCSHLVMSVASLPEAQRYAGTSKDTVTLVNNLYHGIFSRPADADGSNYYSASYPSNGDPGAVLLRIAGAMSQMGGEFTQHCQAFGFH